MSQGKGGGRKKGVPHPPGCGHCSPDSRARAGAKTRGRKLPQRSTGTGADNPAWRGDDASRTAFHRRVVDIFGKASEHPCVDCGGTSYDWSNLTGNYADVLDYAARCRPCHRRYDADRR